MTIKGSVVHTHEQNKGLQQKYIPNTPTGGGAADVGGIDVTKQANLSNPGGAGLPNNEPERVPIGSGIHCPGRGARRFSCYFVLGEVYWRLILAHRGRWNLRQDCICR